MYKNSNNTFKKLSTISRCDTSLTGLQNDWHCFDSHKYVSKQTFHQKKKKNEIAEILRPSVSITQVSVQEKF